MCFSVMVIFTHIMYFDHNVPVLWIHQSLLPLIIVSSQMIIV